MKRFAPAVLAVVLCLVTLTSGLAGAADPSALSEYRERRARLAAELATPVVLFGYEDVSFGLSDPERKNPESTFRQEENFYYLSGHREEGAALLLLPPTVEAKAAGLPLETLYLPPRDTRRESWDGVRLGPGDTGIDERTGFARVRPMSELRGDLERAAKVFPKMHTLLPRSEEGAERTHAGHWLHWLKQALPKTEFENARAKLGAMRQVKSPREQELLRVAIERSMEAHREAMKAMRPGRHEYEIASVMTYTFENAGCERPGYPPIVGSGFNSTVLHYAEPRRRMEPGEVVVIDVGAECSGYTADITRTLPTSGKFSARQREIYEIVLGAQNAGIAAVKPGMTMAREGENSIYKIAYDYINTHGKDLKGEPLGKYFIHGLGHHIGLQVHDAGDPNRPLEPGMILTIEPGIYIPEENLGVRLEDIVLVTKDGAVLLTASLPRTVEAIEHAMQDPARERGSLCVTDFTPPVYPPLAQRARIEGEIEILAEIDQLGQVVRTTARTVTETMRGEANRGAGSMLHQSAQDAVQKWRFGCINGNKVPPIRHTVLFAFEVRGEPTEAPPVVVGFDAPSRIEIAVRPVPTIFH